MAARQVATTMPSAACLLPRRADGGLPRLLSYLLACGSLGLLCFSPASASPGATATVAAAVAQPPDGSTGGVSPSVKTPDRRNMKDVQMIPFMDTHDSDSSDHHDDDFRDSDAQVVDAQVVDAPDDDAEDDDAEDDDAEDDDATSSTAEDFIQSDASVRGHKFGFDWDTSTSALESDSLVEGCVRPATMTSVKVKQGKPKEGHVAAMAIDGDGSTWWARKGRKRWMKVKFEGDEEGDSLVESVAIAFLRGHRRVSYFDLALYNAAGDLVASLKNLESGGLTEDFEIFYFDKPTKGSKVRISLRGTTAGKWNTITEVSTCLVPTDIPEPVPVSTLPWTPDSGITYVGCFEDDLTGLTRFMDGKQVSDSVLTPLTCAKHCAGYKYMGLQFFGECFCGETYYSAEDGPMPSDNCYTPCDGDADVICGGPWTNSVYIVGDPAEKTQEEIDAENVPRVDDGIPRRQFTVTNNCGEQIRIGATGGFVARIEDPDEESCPAGSVLDENVGACFWGLPLPENEKSYDLEPGGSLEIILDNAAINGIRWSGNIWASTGCQSTVGCETGSCLRNAGFPDGYCPPSTGPTGPVTKAEFTLVDTGVDFYDVTTIDGVNLPVEMKPDPKSSPLIRDDDYWCTNPGGTSTMSKGLDGCTWKFDASSIDGFDDDMSSYLRWVRNDGDFTDCETDDDCKGVVGEGVAENLKCGTLFGHTLDGSTTEELFPKKCGSSVGWHSANGICASSSGKSLGYFPNSYPFMCEVETGQVSGDQSTQAHLYGCAGKYYGQSGYSKNADNTACGCPEWVKEGINAPSSAGCQSYNPYWDTLSLPWLKYLKRACPTAYCYPFDDHSSTFVCRNEDENNTHSGGNTMSYTISFCPDDTLSSMLK